MLLGRCGEAMALGAGVADPAVAQRCDDADWLVRGLWGLTGSYSLQGGTVVHYVLDEIGSSFAAAPSTEQSDAAFTMVPFIDPSSGQAFSVFYPRRTVEEWERATCC